MVKQLRIRRLFARGGDGFEPNSIIAFSRRPYEQKTFPHYSTLDFAEVPVFKTYISKYESVLLIDLWLVRLRFRWVGRERHYEK